MSCCIVQDWSEELFQELHNAGGSVFSNYAVGYNNVDVKGATKHGIAVGNTPGQGPLPVLRESNELGQGMGVWTLCPDVLFYLVW